MHIKKNMRNNKLKYLIIFKDKIQMIKWKNYDKNKICLKLMTNLLKTKFKNLIEIYLKNLIQFKKLNKK